MFFEYENKIRLGIFPYVKNSLHSIRATVLNIAYLFFNSLNRLDTWTRMKNLGQ